jgi:hypothetical protein
MATKDPTTHEDHSTVRLSGTMILLELVTAGLATAVIVTLVAILIGAANV